MQGVYGQEWLQTLWGCDCKASRWHSFFSFSHSSDSVCQVGILTNEHPDTLQEMCSSGHFPDNFIRPDGNCLVHSIVLTGKDIPFFDMEDWDMIIGNYAEVIFPRTSPEQKLRIVEEINQRDNNRSRHGKW
jgi:hypothetical protein